MHIVDVASEANAHQAGDQEQITTVEDRVVGFLEGTYFRVTMNIRIPHAIKMWSCLFTFQIIYKNIREMVVSMK